MFYNKLLSVHFLVENKGPMFRELIPRVVSTRENSPVRNAQSYTETEDVSVRSGTAHQGQLPMAGPNSSPSTDMDMNMESESGVLALVLNCGRTKHECLLYYSSSLIREVNTDDTKKKYSESYRYKMKRRRLN